MHFRVCYCSTDLFQTELQRPENEAGTKKRTRIQQATTTNDTYSSFVELSKNCIRSARLSAIVSQVCALQLCSVFFYLRFLLLLLAGFVQCT